MNHIEELIARYELILDKVVSNTLSDETLDKMRLVLPKIDALKHETEEEKEQYPYALETLIEKLEEFIQEG